MSGAIASHVHLPSSRPVEVADLHSGSADGVDRFPLSRNMAIGKLAVIRGGWKVREACQGFELSFRITHLRQNIHSEGGLSASPGQRYSSRNRGTITPKLITKEEHKKHLYVSQREVAVVLPNDSKNLKGEIF